MSLFRTLKMLNVRFPHFLLSVFLMDETAPNRRAVISFEVSRNLVDNEP